MSIHLYENDLPDDLNLVGDLAIDTETMGLNLHRDNLCLIQISTGDGNAHLVQFKDRKYDCPNLKKLLADTTTEKIYHFARFDIASIKQYLGIDCGPIFCTKIASRLCRTYTDKHGLRNLTKELLNVNLDKQQQCSDWGTSDISADQKQYAANDVLFLHKMRDILKVRLEREGRTELAQSCFTFLPARADLDLIGWPDTDISSH
ncbi:MAG: ribonuclease D [Alphaproteobacteria bacterium]|nr:ribonuclease D [Alphaproteobacteria bacterium]